MKDDEPCRVFFLCGFAAYPKAHGPLYGVPFGMWYPVIGRIRASLDYPPWVITSKPPCARATWPTGAFFLCAGRLGGNALKLWLRPILIPVYLLLAAIYFAAHRSSGLGPTRQFVTHDMVPAPFREEANGWPWLETLWQGQMLPGLKNTLILAILAFAATAAFTLISFPFRRHYSDDRAVASWRKASWYFSDRLLNTCWRFWADDLGPSMLPGILALSLHNGAIIGTLVSRYTRTLRLREDAATGMNRYFYEVLPRVYRQFLAYSLHRFEIILRETAILGVLGIPTLGFYIDLAFSENALDRAIILFS